MLAKVNVHIPEYCGMRIDLAPIQRRLLRKKVQAGQKPGRPFRNAIRSWNGRQNKAPERQGAQPSARRFLAEQQRHARSDAPCRIGFSETNSGNQSSLDLLRKRLVGAYRE